MKWVQVSFGPQSWRGLAVYIYKDPTETLQVGDLVTVTGKLRFSVGTVVALGAGDFTGPVTEKVTGMFDYVEFRS